MRGHVGPGCAQELAGGPRRAAPTAPRSGGTRSPLPSGLCPSALPPPLSYGANVATAADSEAGRPSHQAAGLPRRCGLPSAESRFPRIPPRPTPRGRSPEPPAPSAAAFPRLRGKGEPRFLRIKSN